MNARRHWAHAKRFAGTSYARARPRQSVIEPATKSSFDSRCFCYNFSQRHPTKNQLCERTNMSGTIYPIVDFSANGEIVTTLVPSSFARPIGILCIYCGHIESVVDALIWHFLKADRDTGEAITSVQTNFMRKKELMLRLAELHVPKRDMLENLKRVANKADDLFLQRNNLVHGMWEVGHVSKSVAGKFRYSAKGQQKRKYESYTLEKINNLAAIALNIHCDLLNIRQICTDFQSVDQDGEQLQE